ncbi:sugar ABC transporter permease [Rhizobium sp. ZPR3]|uniref:Sugar ABC transporter permease n=2 Tax=unclassified Rhizobium TaxID=2613769 RepID=A0AAU7SQF5_9HYPH
MVTNGTTATPHSPFARGRRFSETVIAATAVTPPMLLMLLFIGIPAVALLATAFTDYSPGIDAEFIGMKNFTTLFNSSVFYAILLRNIGYVIGVVSLQLLVALGIALLLDNELPLRRLWMALLIAPFAISPVVGVVIWKNLLDPSYGLVNYVITSLGLPAVPWMSTPLTSMLAVVIVAVWRGFPFIAIILFAALRGIPTEVKEAAKIDGATAFQIFWHVKLPFIMPALSIMALFETIFAVREFDTIQTMTGGGPGTSTSLLSHYLYRTAFGTFRFGMGAAVGWVMLALTMLMAALIIWRAYRDMFPKTKA